MGFRRRARRRGLVAGAAIGAAAAHRSGGNDAEQPQANEQAPTEGNEAAPAPPPADPVDQLAQLAQLHASGGLTDEEFAAAKAKIIAG